jgi:hypothetical protein
MPVAIASFFSFIPYICLLPHSNMAPPGSYKIENCGPQIRAPKHPALGKKHISWSFEGNLGPWVALLLEVTSRPGILALSHVADSPRPLGHIGAIGESLETLLNVNHRGHQSTQSTKQLHTDAASVPTEASRWGS